jgi:hypothetical protein
MAKIAGKLTDLIGNTPLLELSGYSWVSGAGLSRSWNILTPWEA